MGLDVETHRSSVGYGGAPFGVLLLHAGGPEQAADVRAHLDQLLLEHEPFSVGFILRAPWVRLATAWEARRLRARLRQLAEAPQASAVAARCSAGIEKRLRLRGRDATVRSAQRYPIPSIETALVDLHGEGLRRLVLVLLHPHSSSVTTTAILKEVRRGVAQSGCLFRTLAVEAWFAERAYLDLMAARVHEALQRIDEADEVGEVGVLFCTGAIPHPVQPEDEHYREQVEASVQGIVARLPQTVKWHVCYHPGSGLQRWIRPGIDEAAQELVSRGCRHLLCVPLGVEESGEAAYDIDVRLPRVAGRLGVESLHRLGPLRDHPAFLDAVSDWIVRKLSGE